MLVKSLGTMLVNYLVKSLVNCSGKMLVNCLGTMFLNYCHSPTQPQHELELDLIMGRKPSTTPDLEKTRILGSWILRNIFKYHHIEEHVGLSPTYFLDL